MKTTEFIHRIVKNRTWIQRPTHVAGRTIGQGSGCSARIQATNWVV